MLISSIWRDTLKLVQTLSLALIFTHVSGCTVFNEWAGNKAIPVENNKTIVKKLNVSDALSDPKKSEEYALPEAIGNLDSDTQYQLFAPTTALSILEGSWVDPQSTHPAKILLEKPNLVTDLEQFVNAGVESFAQQKGYLIKPTDTGYQLTQNITEERGFWFFKTDVKVEEAKLLVNVEIKPHGRSGQISIDSLEYKAFDDEVSETINPSQRAESLSIQALNELMLELDYLYRVQVKHERTLIGVTLELATDVAGNKVITSQQDIVYIWKELDNIVETLGFEVEDEDDLLHVLSVSYNKDDLSTWNSLFSSEYANKLNLQPGDYQVSLTTSVDGTQIRLRNDVGAPIEDELVTEFFTLMKKVIEDEEIEM